MWRITRAQEISMNFENNSTKYRAIFKMLPHQLHFPKDKHFIHNSFINLTQKVVEIGSKFYNFTERFDSLLASQARHVTKSNIHTCLRDLFVSIIKRASNRKYEVKFEGYFQSFTHVNTAQSWRLFPVPLQYD